MQAVQYASFWRRLAAAFIDGIILAIINTLIAVILSLIYTMAEFPVIGSILATLINLQYVVIGWIYYAWMESSPHQATFGKRLMKIIVTNLNGNKISFDRATGRHFGKYISTITFLIGYIMAAYTKKKQALHDIMAGTLVINKS